MSRMAPATSWYAAAGTNMSCMAPQCLVEDGLNDIAHPHGAHGRVHEDDEDEHGRHDQQVGQPDRSLGNGVRRRRGPDLCQQGQRVDEGGDERRQRQLGHRLADERAQDARRVLRARHLQRDQRDGEHDAGEGEQRGGDGGEQRPGVVEVGREEALVEREAVQMPGRDVARHPGPDGGDGRPEPERLAAPLPQVGPAGPAPGRYVARAARSLARPSARTHRRCPPTAEPLPSQRSPIRG